VVPCCVFSAQNPQRAGPGGARVSSYQDYVGFLACKHPAIKQVNRTPRPDRESVNCTPLPDAQRRPGWARALRLAAGGRAADVSALRRQEPGPVLAARARARAQNSSRAQSGTDSGGLGPETERNTHLLIPDASRRGAPRDPCNPPARPHPRASALLPPSLVARVLAVFPPPPFVLNGHASSFTPY
jgi:hypothetical protein